MDLVAVPARRRGPVVADRERQEVEHQVRIRHLVVAAHEPAALEVVRRARATPEEQPLEADPRTPPPGQRRLHRDGLRGAVLDVDLEVVLEVRADAGQVRHHVDPERLERGCVTDARELQQLRRVERAAREDDLTGEDPLDPASATGDLDPDRPRSLEQDPRHERAGAHLEVRPTHDRVEVGPRRRDAPPAADVPVEGRETLLPVAVDVVGQLIAGLLRSGEERAEQRVVGRPALERQRTTVAPERVVGAAARQSSIRLK